jgi:hypothetical protein
MRALIVIPRSRVTDATTSPERQLQTCLELCNQRGYEVAGVAEDLDVSGAVDPFDRKKRPNLCRARHRRHRGQMPVGQRAGDLKLGPSRHQRLALQCRLVAGDRPFLACGTGWRCG